MSREPESLTEEALMEEGYWTSHRYHRMFRDVHHHEPWHPCPPNCLGRVYTVTTDGELRSPKQREDGPEYRPDEDPSDNLMDLFKRYDEIEVPE